MRAVSPELSLFAHMKGLTKNQTSTSHWMAAHARLKNEFTEDEKYHNLMILLKCSCFRVSTTGYAE